MSHQDSRKDSSRGHSELMAFWTKQFTSANSHVMAERYTQESQPGKSNVSAQQKSISNSTNDNFQIISDSLHQDTVQFLRAVEKEVDDSDWMFE
ncbi:hypothetical protein EON64_13330 [archaeon]|nr:MAG: hypothetical protein EON64_13330 [archaeon]